MLKEEKTLGHSGREGKILDKVEHLWTKLPRLQGISTQPSGRVKPSPCFTDDFGACEVATILLVCIASPFIKPVEW